VPSQLAWIDHDSKARERTLRILALFQEKESQSASQLSKLLDDIAYNLKPDVPSVAKKPASEVKEIAQQVLTPAIIVEPKSKSLIPMPDATHRNSSTTKLSESWEEYIEFIANNKNEK